MHQNTPRRATALIASAALLASMAVATAAATTVGQGPGTATSENAAGRMSGIGCNTVFGGPLDFRIIENDRNINLTCSGRVDNASSEAQRVLGDDADFGCYIPSPDGGGVTDDEWFAQMSASGKVTLACKAASTRG